MNFFKDFVGKYINMELSGAKQEGILVDYGLDMAVLYNGENYSYIPVSHIRNLRLSIIVDSLDLPNPLVGPINFNTGTISYREILDNAKELFIEISVIGNQLIYGYITEIFEDYFVFFSPVYKTILIPLDHLKWLSLLNRGQTYYTLSKQEISKEPNLFKPASTFKEQLNQLIGNIIIVDMGNTPYKSGLLKDVTSEFIKLITADEESVFFSIKHVQLVQLP